MEPGLPVTDHLIVATTLAPEMSTRTKPQPPERDVLPTVQRLRVRYARRGRLRFSSHRDFQRALERAIRRAGIPIAYSAGFSPHPKISYAGAAPTGAASEAEFLELGVTRRVDPDAVRADLDAALPDGLDILRVVEAAGNPLADRLEASVWEIDLGGTDPDELRAAVAALLDATEITVTRMTKNGRRDLDIRPDLLRCEVREAVADSGNRRETHTARSGEGCAPYAILHVVVRHGTPAVRPDDVLAGLRLVAGIKVAAAPRATRLSQGPWDTESGTVGDPLASDRDAPVE